MALVAELLPSDNCGGRLSVCAGWRLIFYYLMGSVMNGKRQSDNHDDNHEKFVIGYDHHLPFVREGKSQAPSVSFLPEAMGFTGNIA